MKTRRIISAIMALAMIVSMMGVGVYAEEPTTFVGAKIDENSYETLAAAIKAANDMTDCAVTVEIYGEVEFTDGMELNGSYESITFTGMADGATITISQSAGGDYLEAHGKTVAFTELKLAKANPAWAGNSGHMGNYFSVQGGTVTYTNCTFPNGACTSGGTATYNECTFENTSEYGLWVYDDAIVTVVGGTINSKKGIKVYSEGEDSVTSELTVKNATFTENVTAKPAVAIGYAESITLIGNTYNNTTGVLELDSGSDADCEGITFVAQDADGNDIASTLTAVDRSGSNAACGVLVDGKIYTTVETAAEDATSGSTVTLLFNSSETVELPEGVTLDTNGYTAENVTVATPVDTIDTMAELKEAIQTANSELTVGAILTVAEGETVNLDLNGCTVDMGNYYIENKGTLTIKNGTLVSTESANETNGAPLYNYGGTLTVDGGTYTGVIVALRVEGGTATINDGTFSVTSTSGASNHLIRMKGDTLTINGGTFNGNNADNGIEGCVIMSATGGTTEIKGGTFNGFAGASMFGTGTGVTVKGGTFNPDDTDGFSLEDCLADYLAAGYEVDDNGVVEESPVVNDGDVAFIDANKNGLKDEGENGYSTLAEALTAAAEIDGAVTVTLLCDAVWETGAGHGSTPLVPADSDAIVTIEGNDFTITATGAGVGSLRAANDTLLTFNNVNFVDESVSYAESAWEFTYLEFGGKLEFNNCDFADEIQVDADNGTAPDTNAVFTNCTFESNEESVYAVWLGNGSFEFENCYFTGYRGLKMHEDYGSEIDAVTLNKCEFDTIEKKPGIAIGDLDADTAVTVTNCTMKNVKEGDQGAYLYESDTDVTTFNFTTDDNKVFVGEEQVYPVVMIGEAEYGTLAHAIANAQDGDTVKLMVDVTLTESIYVNNIVIVDLNGNDIIVDDGYAISVAGDLTVNGEGTLDGSFILTDAGATVTADEGLDVATTVANAKVTYANGVYSVATSAGALNVAYTSASYVGGIPAVFGEATGVVATDSFVVKLYSGEALVGTATLVDNDKILLNGESKTITWHAALTDDGDEWWSTEWTNGALNINAIPDKAELYVDGTMVSTCDVQLNINDLNKPIFAAVTDENGNIRSFVAGTGYLNGTGGNAPVYDEALQTALKAGGNITMLRDVKLNDSIKVSEATLTLDGNGHSISGNGALWFLSGNYDIKNLVFDNITTTDEYGILEFTYAKANVAGCTFNNNNAENCIAVDTNANSDGNSVVTINGCTFTDNTCSTSVVNSAEGATTVQNSAITDNTASIAVIYNSANCNVTGNVFSGNTLTGENANKAVILTGPWVAGEYTVSITENAFLDEEYVAVYVENWAEEYGAVSTNVLDGNYWLDGNAPVAGTDYVVEDGAAVTLYNYYSKYNTDGTLDDLVSTTPAPVEVSTYEELAALFTNGDRKPVNVIMKNDITGTAALSSGYGEAGIVVQKGDVLDGNGHKLTINGADGTWDCAVAIKGGTVKNLTISGAFRGIFMPGANGDAVIDNCVLEDVIYTFNSDAGSTEYGVTIKNTTLNGWTSYSAVHESVEFENCTFGEGNGYAFCRPYQATTFTGCEFNEGFEFDATKVTSDETLEFNDCTYAGEKLSAENSAPMFYNGGTVVIDDATVVFDKYIPPELPTATVTEIDDENAPELTFALNFKAGEATEEQLEYYGDWYADFVLIINKDFTANANGNADGYLSGQYDAWSENWVNVPFEDVTIKAGEPLKIMEYAASLMNQSGLKLTYNDVYNFVKDFDCGVFFTEEYLTANPDLEVTLELRMYNPEDESESYVIGETYEFEAPVKEEVTLDTKNLTIINMGKVTDDEGVERFRVAFCAGIDSLNYKEVGFEISYPELGVETSLSTTIVYDDLTVYRTNGETANYTPAQFGEECEYLFFKTAQFGTRFDNAKLEWRPYAITFDGTKLVGKTSTIDDIYTLEY